MSLMAFPFVILGQFHHVTFFMLSLIEYKMQVLNNGCPQLTFTFNISYVKTNCERLLDGSKKYLLSVFIGKLHCSGHILPGYLILWGLCLSLNYFTTLQRQVNLQKTKSNANNQLFIDTQISCLVEVRLTSFLTVEEVSFCICKTN